MKRLDLVAALVFVAIAASGAAQTPPRNEAAPDGAQLYRTWCASCHGVTAQGNGPLAPMMRRPVSDLTQIAAKNGGMFPTARVRRIVDGREVEAHGDPDMPIWGTAFKSTRDGYSEASVRARIDAIVKFLESIQKRNAH
jgi:mono/diheme cytochrome c family protein